MSNKIIRIILILVVACGIGLLAYNKINKDDALASERKATMGGSRDIMADAYIVRATSLQNDINATGTLLSNESIVVQPEISGRITHLYFKEGAYVKKGDLLVTLYDGDLTAQLDKTKIQQRLADTMLSRQQQLLRINGISRQNVDNTSNQVAAYEADIDYYKAEISKTRIVAPFNGRVGLRQVSEGAIVSPTTVITTLYQNDPLKLEFSVPEKYRNQLKRGDQVSFKVSEMPDEQFTGKVYALNPGIDPQTRTVTLRALVSNKAGKLASGSFANVHINLREIAGALMIPTQSLISTTQNSQVILNRNGKAAFVTVETGIRTPDKVQILSGLKPGDTVLTTGIMQAGPGDPLKIMQIDSE